jgi:hypothetical protein
MVKVPQLTELRGMVQLLSEYAPKFADVDIVPVEDTVVDVVMAEKVISDKASPIMINAAVIAPHKNLVFHLKPFFKSLSPLALLLLSFSKLVDALLQLFLKQKQAYLE